jgi:hypothetical protein
MGLASPIAGFVAPFVIYAFIFLCHLLLPARVVDGYVMDPLTGQPRRYRLNGLLVLTVTLAAYFVLTTLEAVRPDWLYQQPARPVCSTRPCSSCPRLPAAGRGWSKCFSAGSKT